MPSTFTWLDFSEHERRKALDVIDLFREKDTRDELGVGTVRDALADLLFPGTSTIQTRARYFLFVPWLYRRLERQKSGAADAARLARRAELNLIDALANGGEKDGVIGIEARQTLKRLPSSVYWQGLAVWGIRVLDISQSDYHRFFATFVAGASPGKGEDEGDREGSGRMVWHAVLPEAPADFPEKATMSLRQGDAEYLRERILLKQPGSLLAYLVDRGAKASACDFPWEHPQQASFTDRNKVELEHARKFAVVMHGARLLYNLLLAEKSRNEERIERFKGDLDDWAAEIEAERAEVRAWDRQAFWDLVLSVNKGIGVPTRGFINAWLDLVLSNDAASIKGLARARTLVADRERRLKGPLSRLVNQRALELWGGESGAYRDSFRWFRVQTIVNDIVKGMHSA